MLLPSGALLKSGGGGDVVAGDWVEGGWSDGVTDEWGVGCDVGGVYVWGFGGGFGWIIRLSKLVVVALLWCWVASIWGL